MIERPLAEQTLRDVLGFLGRAVGENLTLDYKREVSPENSKDNAELCKDVSAMANSAGGTIIYGVDEEKPERTPALPPHGIARRVGRQPVEEWAAQVLASGVQPRMDLEIGVYDLPEDPAGQGPGAPGADAAGRCVMAIRVTASPYAPHMVTLKGDNRYYGRFYRRSNYESRVAEEYEVREMLERARRLYEGVEREVARRGFGDPSSEDFADKGSSHDRGRIVRLGRGFWLCFGPLAVFRYEFSGLIRAYEATSLLDLPETRSRMSIPVRVSRSAHTYAVPAGKSAPFTARSNQF